MVIDLAGKVAGVVTPIMFVAFLAAETLFPLRKQTRKRPARYLTNFGMTVPALAMGAVIAKLVANRLTVLVGAKSFGLVNLVPLPVVFHGAIGFLLLDMTFYLWHRANHVYPILWRFHNVHHVDPDLDVTTSFRFHIVEVTYSAIFRALQILVIGVSPATYFTYGVIFQWATMFHHSNIHLPLRLERVLNKVFVTPRMHGVHHSVVPIETHSNYSVVFRWWDAAFRTLRLGVRQADITIGIAAYNEDNDNSIGVLYAMPFAAQEKYWLFPDGAVARRTEESGANRMTE